MEEQIIGTFWGQVQFLFLFFPDCLTSKFLEMKCNPTNRKTVALTIWKTLNWGNVI